ncbi:MAG TPA: peptidylprolyl isomerase [Candidatus Egerieousia sp.]|nr:peptidylprolyl isomerase [Candidatus Egerieousia sp.]HPT06086.1 peptidylprolyl isomerase [Candidatus Egerieousia sp.]
MNKVLKVFCTGLFGVIVFLAGARTAQAQVYQKGLIDKTIAIVGNEPIMLSQLEDEVQMMQAQGMTSDKNVRCQILESMLSAKLFLNQARLDSLNIRPDQVEAEINERLDKAMTQLGGEKETEAYFKKPLFKLKEDWRSLLNEQNLTQQEQQQVMRAVGELTPSEVKRFYKKVDKDSLPIISTQYRLSQIVLYPSKEQATMAVKERLLGFRQRVLNGEKFSMLAALYSEDPGSAVRGGELRMASKNIYWPAFSDAAMSLKPGQISQIIETPDGFHLIQMIEKDGDMFNARHILLKPKYTDADRDKAFKTLDSVRTKIVKDSITFERAARFFSEDPKTRVNGGQMSDENSGSIYFEKDQLKPADYNVLKDMKVGDISQPFESADNETRVGHTIYKIIRLDEIIPSHPANVKDDFTVIQNIANQQKQTDAIKAFVEEKQKSTYIKVDDMFKDCPFESSGWIK